MRLRTSLPTTCLSTICRTTCNKFWEIHRKSTTREFWIIAFDTSSVTKAIWVLFLFLTYNSWLIFSSLCEEECGGVLWSGLETLFIQINAISLPSDRRFRERSSAYTFWILYSNDECNQNGISTLIITVFRTLWKRRSLMIRFRISQLPTATGCWISDGMSLLKWWMKPGHTRNCFGAVKLWMKLYPKSRQIFNLNHGKCLQ
jgi:hypothetical protein